MANDDSHKREQYCGGWNMVKCEEFTIPSMLDSLKKVVFIQQQVHRFMISIEDGVAYVKCSEAKSITFITLSNWGKCYRIRLES